MKKELTKYFINIRLYVFNLRVWETVNCVLNRTYNCVLFVQLAGKNRIFCRFSKHI